MAQEEQAQEKQDRLSVDAGGQGLVAHLEGREPPAPDWFRWAVTQEPERSRISVAGAGIEVLAWGERGRPGLVFLHGNGAHADWWSFIAPFFADRYRVVAPSWSGMGDSDWRPVYSLDLCVKEALAAVETQGAFDGPDKPLIVAHSFGGFPAMGLACDHGSRLKGVVSVDSPVMAPDDDHDGPPTRRRPNRAYPSLTAALARFRLAPPQACANLFAVDHIARRSLKETAEGFTWKFDPFLWDRFEGKDVAPLVRAAACPIAVLFGDRSGLMRERTIAHMRELFPKNTPFVAIPDADHHVLLDQPLAFIAALRALFAAWPGAA